MAGWPLLFKNTFTIKAKANEDGGDGKLTIPRMWARVLVSLSHKPCVPEGQLQRGQYLMAVGLDL